MDFGLYEYFASFFPELVVSVPFVGMTDLAPYCIAAAVFIILTAIFKIIQVIVLVRLESLSKKTTTDVDDVLVGAVRSIRAWVYTIVALYIALQPFSFPGWADTTFKVIFLVAIVWQAIEFATKLVDYGVKRFLGRGEDGDGEIDPNSATATDMMTLISRILFWVFGGIFVLSNLGIEVTSLLAGLGIGGIAIAFALQGILSDLFASFSIYFDKPFRIGDFIVLGTDSGTVEKIGIKSTRIRTLQGEELVVSNAELTTARVQNFKKMQERRLVSQFGVIYETPLDKLREIPGIASRIFEDIEDARLDRVHFVNLGDYSLDFEVVFFVKSAKYSHALDIQQQYHLTLMERFAELGIEFAYPTAVEFTKEFTTD